MKILHDELWRRIWTSMLTRRAVRVVFLGPDSEPDPRIEEAKKAGNVKPMDSEFFGAIKDFLALTEERGRQWSEIIKPKADQAMSAVWARLWKTPEGRAYQEMKAEVDRRKSQVDGICKRAEDGVAQKIIAGGRVVTFIKTHVLVGREDMIEQARQNIGHLKNELAQAKERLKNLENGGDEAYERLNMLVVEELKAPTKPAAGGLSGMWRRRAGVEAVQEGLVAILEIEELIADELLAADNVVGEFLAVLESMVAQEISEEDLRALEPETEEETVVA